MARCIFIAAAASVRAVNLKLLSRAGLNRSGIGRSSPVPGRLIVRQLEASGLRVEALPARYGSVRVSLDHVPSHSRHGLQNVVCNGACCLRERLCVASNLRVCGISSWCCGYRLKIWVWLFGSE